MKNEPDIDRFVDIGLIICIITIIVLKVVGVITIPWVWLLSPIWFPLAGGIVLALALILFLLIERIVKK